jgi:hypothetical protein
VFRWVISVRVGIWAPVGPVTRARGLRKFFARGATRARIGRVRGCPRAESRALGLGYTQRGREARGSGCEGRGRGWSGRGGPVDAVSGLPAAGSGGSEGANGRKR